MTKNDQTTGFSEQLVRERRERLKGYRERALKLFPWVCARCTREFSGKRVKELTVHHKNHNHEDNPPDGSNWELLCLYCHEYEHANNESTGIDTGTKESPVSTFKAFQGLEGLLKQKKQDKDIKSE